MGTVAVAVVPWIHPAIDKPHAICFCRKLDLPSQPIRFGFDSIRLQVALEYRCIHACTFRTFPLSILVFLTSLTQSPPARPPSRSFALAPCCTPTLGCPHVQLQHPLTSESHLHFGTTTATPNSLHCGSSDITKVVQGKTPYLPALPASAETLVLALLLPPPLPRLAFFFPLIEFYLEISSLRITIAISDSAHDPCTCDYSSTYF